MTTVMAENPLLGHRSNRLHPVTRRLFEILGDGEWHDYDATIREVAKVVTPGEAAREMEYQRSFNQARRGADYSPRSQRDLGKDIERGSRRLVVQTIHSLSRVEVDPPGRFPRGTKRSMRLRPPDLSRTAKQEPPPPPPPPPPPTEAPKPKPKPKPGVYLNKRGVQPVSGGLYDSGRRPDEDPAEIRRWAVANGANLPVMGRLPRWVVDLYRLYQSDSGQVDQPGSKPVSDPSTGTPDGGEISS